MAKDFFQDILPKDDARAPRRERIQGDEVDVPSDTAPEPTPVQLPERSIRNINVNRPRPIDRMSVPERRPLDSREAPPVGSGMPRLRRPRPIVWLWALAGVLLVIIGLLVVFVFRSTSITVTPRAQTIVFDSAKTFTAYPAAAAPAGELAYSLQSFDLDDSQAVTSTGSAHVERKASGSVTLVNEYSSQPVKLVKTTRFETPAGLIFRAPADISIPGMKGNTPGTITITIVADQPGTNYNIGPTSRFSLPGLKGGVMYDKVYARSTGNFSGGFSGEEPSVTPAAKNAAVSEMQGRLNEKASLQLATLQQQGTVFPSFASITFEELPATPGAESGKVNLNLRARVQVPVLPSEDFNRRIAATVSADAEGAKINLVPRDGFKGTLLNATSTSYGATPITFALEGTAQLVWEVDTGALAEALSGKDEAVFQTVVNGFPGIQEARARIEPFWRRSFPSEASKIQIVVTEPKEPPASQ